MTRTAAYRQHSHGALALSFVLASLVTGPLGAPPQASAATVSYSDTLTSGDGTAQGPAYQLLRQATAGQMTPGAASLSPVPFSLSVPQFDPALGTLTSVEISVSAEVESLHDSMNDTFLNGGRAFQSQAEVSIQYSGTFTGGIVSGSLASHMRYAEPLPYSPDLFSDSATDQYAFLGLNAVPFIGSETIDVAFASWLQLTASNEVGPNAGLPLGAGESISQSAVVMSQVLRLDVTYTFQPIPEPSTAVLGTLGAFGLLWRFKRRRAPDLLKA